MIYESIRNENNEKSIWCNDFSSSFFNIYNQLYFDYLKEIRNYEFFHLFNIILFLILYIIILSFKYISTTLFSLNKNINFFFTDSQVFNSNE